MANATLSISSSELNEDALQNLTLELLRTIDQETDVIPTLPEKPSKIGEKGEPITLGVIVLALITSGTAVAVIRAIQSYLERIPSLIVKFKHKDGQELEIQAKNVRPDQIDRTMELVRDFFKQ